MGHRGAFRLVGGFQEEGHPEAYHLEAFHLGAFRLEACLGVGCRVGDRREACCLLEDPDSLTDSWTGSLTGSCLEVAPVPCSKLMSPYSVSYLLLRIGTSRARWALVLLFPGQHILTNIV